MKLASLMKISVVVVKPSDDPLPIALAYYALSIGSSFDLIGQFVDAETHLKMIFGYFARNLMKAS